MIINWKNVTTVNSKKFVCSYCGNTVVSQVGYHRITPSGTLSGAIHICPFCSDPTFFDLTSSTQVGPVGTFEQESKTLRKSLE